MLKALISRIEMIVRRSGAVGSGPLTGSILAFAVKLLSSALGFAMFALLATQMEPIEFGRLAMVFNALSFLAILALLGQETLIVRSWQEYIVSARPALAQGVLRFGGSLVLGSAFCVAIATAATWHWLNPHVDAGVIVASCSFLFAQTLMHFSGQFARITTGILIGDTPREILWRSIVIAILGFHYLAGTSVTTTEFFVYSTIGLAAGILIQVSQILPRIPAAILHSKPSYDLRFWAERSAKMWTAALLDTSGQYLEVVLIGILVDPVIAGTYFVCTRITNVAAMIGTSIMMYATVHISSLFHSGAKRALQHQLNQLAVVAAVLVVSALAIMVFGGHFLLSIFGDSYVWAYPALVILAIGPSLLALSGPAEHLLLLTGHEIAYARVASVALVLRLVLVAALGSAFGITGIAVAVSVASILAALGLTVTCRTLIGIDPSLLGVVFPISPPAKARRDDQ